MRAMSAIIIVFPMKEEAAPNRIREFRKAKGWTIEELAHRADCSGPTIHDLERGKLRLSVKWMRILAPLFDVAPADLLADEDFPARLRGDARLLNQIFHAATEEQKSQILRVAKALAESDKAA